MRRGAGQRDDLFGLRDPFAGFGGFGRPGNLMSSFFGGRDPFDDPFFTNQFGSIMGPSIFGPSIFHSVGSRFGEACNTELLEQRPMQHNRSSRPIIQELSDDEDEQTVMEMEDDSEKHSRSSKQPYAQTRYEETKENETSMQSRNVYERQADPRAHVHSFQTSTVTYGGLNGAYYTSSTTRRAGTDGVMLEESKEADTTTGKATHRISRGIHEKGHSVTRKLNSDGRVDTLQTLHNLNEDELAGFNEAWKGSARQHLPGWNAGFSMHDDDNMRSNSSSSSRREEPSQRRALPSTHLQSTGKMKAQSGADVFSRGA